MSVPGSSVAFVLGSSVRREVLGRVEGGDATGKGIVADSAASESAVYEALNRLEERGLVREADGRWRLTGAGRLVADAIDQCDRLERVLEAESEYWRSHDPAALPPELRRELHLLEGCSVVRSPDTDPYRAARQVERAIERAEEVAIVAVAYNDRHAEALLESDADRRLLMDPPMVEQLLRTEPAGPDDDGIEEVDIRVAEVNLSLVLTDREVLLSLPRCEGGFDTTTELRADTDRAVQWGRRVFEHFWRGARPVDEWIAAELPEYATGDTESRHAPRSFEES